jgi:hypothetical protein
METQRDDQHVEQHGDGDVNINPAPETPAEQPAEGGNEGGGEAQQDEGQE